MNQFFKKVIHEKAKVYHPALLPKEIPRGKVGDCFDFCLALCVTHPEYRYVEGLVFINNKWIYHAWLTDSEGILAYDPTWKAVTKEGKEMPLFMAKYFGVVMDTKKVMEFYTTTEYKALLKNYWRDKKLAEECIC